MKKVILGILLLSLFSIGCSKNSNEQLPVPPNPCASVTSFSVVQQSGSLTFDIVSTSTPLYYEVSYQQATANPSPGNGNTFIINGLTTTKSISELSISQSATYVFYVRAICSESSSSNWSAPKALTINSYCNSPTNLFYGGGQLAWTDNTGDYPTNSQIQYGPTGFSLGSGITINAGSASYYSGFTFNPNTNYSFYVRSYCNDSQMWSPWSDPVTYQNGASPCPMPSNLSHQIESLSGQNAYVSLHWVYNGSTNFEYTVVLHGNSVSSGTILTASTSGWPVITLNRSYTYDFYMRTVCSNGLKTAWTSPYLISNL